MSIQFHKIWIEQCEAAEGIREHFGLQNALDYLIGEKLFHFVQAAEQHPEFAAELPAFVVEIQRQFTAVEICEYLDDLEKRKYLASREPDPEPDELHEEDGRTLAGQSGHGRRRVAPVLPYSPTLAAARNVGDAERQNRPSPGRPNPQ